MADDVKREWRAPREDRPVTGPDLIPEQREMLEKALRGAWPGAVWDAEVKALAPVVARMIADAEQRVRREVAEGDRQGAARVTEAVEAALSTFAAEERAYAQHEPEPYASGAKDAYGSAAAWLRAALARAAATQDRQHD